MWCVVYCCSVVGMLYMLRDGVVWCGGGSCGVVHIMLVCGTCVYFNYAVFLVFTPLFPVCYHILHLYQVSLNL